MRKKYKLLLGMMLVFAMMTGCTQQAEIPKESETESVQSENVTMQVGMLKGPTGIGAVKLMEENETGKSVNQYDFQVAAAPDELMGKVINGEIEVASLPTNVAATVYNKTDGEIKVAAINTLGVLHILENGNSIQSLADLQGKTIYATGQGATPEYVLNYLLEKNNVPNVTVNYMAEHAELAGVLAAGEVKIGLLPEPNVTGVLMKNTDVREAIDLTDEWEKVESNSKLAMGCIVVRQDFLNNHKEEFNQFLEEYQASVNYVNENPADAAKLVEKFQILPSAVIAEQAIPNCNIVFIDGTEMKTALQGFYDVLFRANPKSVGGTLPDENFYYQK